MSREAMFQERCGDLVLCTLCPHLCAIRPHKRGRCGVRKNADERLVSQSYGRVSALQVDPMEKKPLFHFKPGWQVLSVGGIGCNMKCLNCQNSHISIDYKKTEVMSLKPEEIPGIARQNGVRAVAFTYNEPTVWYEFMLEAAKACKAEGLATVMVTNGYINPEPLKLLAPHIDAMNIDVKAWSEEFYREVCGASLLAVARTVRDAYMMGVHVELTWLMIPGLNDGEADIRAFARGVATLDRLIPVHFTAFRPAHKMTDRPPTQASDLKYARGMAMSEGLRFVYMGNVNSPDGRDTLCPDCGRLMIRRDGLTGLQDDTHQGHCRCGSDLNIR